MILKSHKKGTKVQCVALFVKSLKWFWFGLGLTLFTGPTFNNIIFSIFSDF
jgi:hypothetical protein